VPSSQASSADAERLLARHLAAFSGVTVLVLGDAMLDRYVHGDVRRISPEAPIPVLRARTRRFVLGGAGNVAENAAALGARAILVGLIGDDAAGQELSATLQGRIGNGLVRVPGRPTTVKTRFMSGGHQLLRLCAIDAGTGAVRTVVEETSAAFVDYSQKTWLHWLADGRTLLWASERDGWNHLFLHDLKTGKAIRCLTPGNWVVRSIVEMNSDKREILVRAMGIHAGQDPYHEHLVRVTFDGRDGARVREAAEAFAALLPAGAVIRSE
jgi:hypothetical protein